MDRYSIFEQVDAPRRPNKPWFLPADGSGKSATAERDLEATLQLLAERARYLTGASGVSIGLRSGTVVVCRASAGPLGLELGSRLPVDSGPMTESLRLRQILRCEDDEKDSCKNTEIWPEPGIASTMVGPLLRGGEMVGVFELVAERVRAFEERNVNTMHRLSEMMVTALEHFNAASQEPPISKTVEMPATQTESKVTVAAVASGKASASAGVKPQIAPALATNPPTQEPSNTWKVQRCQACGFPISEIRTLCLDCEETQDSEQPPAFLGNLSAAGEPGWLQSHLYTMGTLFIAALTVALLVLKLR